jgi:3-hydroxyisobutyrate dehydrogenase
LTDRSTVAFLGLGAMGTPMIERLHLAGHAVRGFDVAESARARVEAKGVPVRASAAEATTGANVVVLMLPDSGVVESVLSDLETSRALARGTVVIDMSSSEPLRTRALAERLSASDIEMLDAPVSGGVKGASAGSLTVMVGGDQELLERHRELLEIFGRVIHAGPIGSGHAVKALNNLLSATHLLVTSEAMMVGEDFGIEPEVMLSVFNVSSGRSGSTENKWPNFILPGSYDSGFALRLMVKDMKIAVDLAERSGVACQLGEESVTLWQKAANALEPDADHTEIARWLASDGERR